MRLRRNQYTSITLKLVRVHYHAQVAGWNPAIFGIAGQMNLPDPPPAPG
jgi:hypothetical protein